MLECGRYHPHNVVHNYLRGVTFSAGNLHLVGRLLTRQLHVRPLIAHPQLSDPNGLVPDSVAGRGPGQAGL